jgi:hypothetical protein
VDVLPSASQVRPARLAPAGVVLAIVPIIVVHACYVVSAIEGHVEWCNPYWDGCSSISRAGRHGWAFFLFKAGMLPYAAALAGYWWLCRQWLRGLGGRGSNATLASGLVGVLFLVLYATFLGSDGEVYAWLRRTGIYFYFVGTFVAQALLVHELRTVMSSRAAAPATGLDLPAWLLPTMTGLGASVVALGIAFAVVGRGFDIERHRLENAIEWVVALAMQLSLLFTVVGWRATGLSLVVVTGRSAIAGPGRRSGAGDAAARP